MNFLADQDVYAATVRFLAALGHDVLPVSQLGLSRADDAQLLRVAQEQGRLLVTRDRDYGGLVFVQGSGAGVIYLRVLPATLDSVHAEIARALSLHKEEELRRAFLVIEPGRYRIRKIQPDPKQEDKGF